MRNKVSFSTIRNGINEFKKKILSFLTNDIFFFQKEVAQTGKKIATVLSQRNNVTHSFFRR